MLRRKATGSGNKKATACTRAIATAALSNLGKKTHEIIFIESDSSSSDDEFEPPPKKPRARAAAPLPASSASALPPFKTAISPQQKKRLEIHHSDSDDTVTVTPTTTTTTAALSVQHRTKRTASKSASSFRQPPAKPAARHESSSNKPPTKASTRAELTRNDSISSSISKSPSNKYPSALNDSSDNDPSRTRNRALLSRKRERLEKRRTDTAEARRKPKPSTAHVVQDHPVTILTASTKKKKRAQTTLVAAAETTQPILKETLPITKKRSRPQRTQSATKRYPEVEAKSPIKGRKADMDEQKDMQDRPSTPTAFLEEDEPATPDFLASHCWRCKCRVTEIDGNACFYAMHVHPLLQVPCCSVCCEIATAIDAPDDQENIDVCSVCGDGGGALLLCDMCPRGFCRICTAQAWGGGALGLRRVAGLAKDEKGWACIVCSPPTILVKLQIQDTASALVLLESSEGNDSAAAAAAAKKNNDTVEQVVEKITDVEDELEHYQTMVLTDANMERVEEEVRQELTKETSKELLEEQVDEEMALYKEKQQWHYDLLQDQKVDLLERLNAFNISDDMYYKYYNKNQKSAEESDSEWRRNADSFNDRRDMVEREAIRQSQHESSSSDDESHCEREALEEVEDLCTGSQPEEWETEEVVKSRSLWKTEHHSREWFDKKLTKYMRNDDEMLKKARSRVTKVDTANDEEQIRQEFARSSATSKDTGGVTIRRDELIQFMKVRKKPEPADAAQKKEYRRPGTPSRSSSSTPARTSLIIPIPFRPLTNGQQIFSKNAAPISALVQRGRVHATSEDVDDALLDDIPAMKPYEGDNFWDSCTELSSDEDRARTVRIAEALASQLKPHQVEGVKFLWENACKDLSSITTQEEAREEKGVGGCICAHMMGLGKSLQIVTLAHTLLNHPNLRPSGDEKAKPFISTILLIVPVNTIANWKIEFDRWTGRLQHQVRIFDMSQLIKNARLQAIRTWSQKGGVLLIGSDMYASLLKNNESVPKYFQDPGPDLVVIDEAHTLLKKDSSQISKRLGPIRTKRRIILSGTPFVNNLKEYFQLVDWVRPGVFGNSTQFEREYVKPIMAGLASDSSIKAVAVQVQKSKQLFAECASFMQRRDISILKRDLPPCQTVVFYIRQSKMQTRLYRRFDQFAKKLKNNGEELPFITQYQTLRPLHNHPFCLLQSARGISKRNSIRREQEKKIEASLNAVASLTMEATNGTKRNECSNTTEVGVIDILESESEEGLPTSGRNSPVEPSNEDRKPTAVKKVVTKAKKGRRPMEFSWLESAIEKAGESNVESVMHGNKIFLLLQIVANAQCVGDKVVVFSQCLKTLDFIEKVLHTDWARFCRGREQDKTLGHWRKGIDYLRIDGSINSSERGEIVASFHEEFESHKLMLLSIEAGGIGINLVAANRVVLFDNHWNPTVSSQAFHRCYRYGQDKPVYGYRFITEGSMEEKIFSRSMNKSGVAARVIDLQFPERLFSERELAEIKSTDSWVQCDSCDKWRMLFFESEEELPIKWHCKMNTDLYNKTCSALERDSKWYEKHRSRIIGTINRTLDEKIVGSRESIDVGNGDKADLAKEELVRKDDVLMSMGLLDLFKNKKKKDKTKIAKRSVASVISKIEFQEMLQVESADLEIEASHREAEAAAAKEAESLAIAAAKLEAEAAAAKRSQDSEIEASHREAEAAVAKEAESLAIAAAKLEAEVAAAKRSQDSEIEASREVAAATFKCSLALEIEASILESERAVLAAKQAPLVSSDDALANRTSDNMNGAQEMHARKNAEARGDSPATHASISVSNERSQNGSRSHTQGKTTGPATCPSTGQAGVSSAPPKTNRHRDNQSSSRRPPRSFPSSEPKKGSLDEPIELLESDSEEESYV